jgi:hypothetical protein
MPALIVGHFGVVACAVGAGIAGASQQVPGFAMACIGGAACFAFVFWVQTFTGWRMAGRWDLFEWSFFVAQSERPSTFLFHQLFTLALAGVLVWLGVQTLMTDTLPFDW